MDGLRSWRVPVAVVLLLAMAVRVGASVAGIIGAAVDGSPVGIALATAGIGSGDVVLSVALAAVCWWCAAGGVRAARALSILAFVLVSLQILLSLGASVAGFLLSVGQGRTAVLSLLAQLTWLVVPVLAAAVLVRAAREPGRAEASAPGEAAAPVAPEPVAPEPISPEPISPESTEAEPSPQPYAEAAGWAPDEAAGAAWTSAGEAARGGSAAGWGSALGSGWEPTEWTTEARHEGSDAPPTLQ